MSAYAISNNFPNTQTDSEGQSSTHPLHGWHLAQPNHPCDADVMSSPLIYRAQPILAPYLDTISVLTPDYLSTGAPRLVPQWWRCCGCSNLVNPSLASEKCPICSHSECGNCSTETVP
ncbi:hypothetical protein PCH_Pc21g00750 [Penicillium rubens Wisconsin 54-1255]|uniref:RanBP2-type domain-containing protein n=1 Tax=Penicillium rubens (strain ATCC 28089 / DSM 1075 / NRRL 1951 / Wisconsin 54-1255) TaxID=500485 RepID=B6HHF8_PENRW|nr:uncharacterized protein N7525_008450 [Penicillium rubens]KAJ5830197.1 hypothetical protein N7525_008450 [Penicillium rubens]CAP94972.1 hypothetical protein PCH_Pc21g00750 [Penicillium rubens Wisconsin 54-1255]